MKNRIIHTLGLIVKLLLCLSLYLLHRELLDMWLAAAEVTYSFGLLKSIAGFDIILCAAPDKLWQCEVISILFAVCIFVKSLNQKPLAMTNTLVLLVMGILVCGAVRCMKYFMVSKMLFNGATPPDQILTGIWMTVMFVIVYTNALLHEVSKYRLHKRNP
jgi:hypothetical protein